VRSCFPRTPHGWVPVLPAGVDGPGGAATIQTDGERVRLAGSWETAEAAAGRVSALLAQGAAGSPLQADGVCLILQSTPGAASTCTAVLIDPGYLAPTGVATTLRATRGRFRTATDLVSGLALPVTAEGCDLHVAPGAFRLVRVDW
jgi:hypothetical protein